MADPCWFMKKSDVRMLTVRRTAAIGDVLSATCVAIKLAEAGWAVKWQCHPDILTMIRRVPSIAESEEPAGVPHCDLDGVYENHPRRGSLSFADMFMASAGQQLDRFGTNLPAPHNCPPVLCVDESEKASVLARFHNAPRPWIVFAARSNSHANRTIPDHILSQIAMRVGGSCFWVANHAPAPEGFIDLNVRDLSTMILCIACADLYVGPDTGPMHIAAALSVPVIAVCQASSPELHLSDQRDFQALHVPGLGCLNCQKVICPIPGEANHPPCTHVPPEMISNAANTKLAFQSSETISAVVPTFRAPAERLNRCLESILNQVDEIVVCRDAGGTFPAGAMTHPKIKYVVSRQSELGYGRNANFGVRHTNGRWVLLLNDDCFLDHNAIKYLKDAVDGADVGMVGHLLRYPDGKICHAGKYRNPGDFGWSLLDNRQLIPTIKEAREMENVTGTSVLVRREAYYDIHGFDEDFFCYTEDDDFCIRMRRNGWRVMYTPHATGIHMEASTTRMDGKIRDHVAHGNTTFWKKHGDWLMRNIKTIPAEFP